MSQSQKTLFFILGVLLIAGGGLTYAIMAPADPEGSTLQAKDDTEAALRVFVDEANKASGIQSGAAFNYTLVGYGNPVNFGIVRCRDEVRCDTVVEKQVAKFQQPNQPSPDTAEVSTDTNAIVSLQRAVPNFVGDELPAEEVERIVRQFLEKVYPDFKTVEPTLTFEPGMKGARLNNGNYFFRWNAPVPQLPDDVQAELPPFVQVGITASGFIFSYGNTIPLFNDL